MELTETDSYCPGSSCSAYTTGYEEFCGYCPECWKDLEPGERAVFQGKEPPVKEVVTHKVITTHFPPAPWIGWRVGLWAWRVATATTLAWLLWRVK